MSFSNAVQIFLDVKLSSSVPFTAIIDEITNPTSGKHIVRFSNFYSVNCRLFFYSVYCNSCVLGKLMHPIIESVRCWPRWCPKCFPGGRNLEKI